MNKTCSTYTYTYWEPSRSVLLPPRAQPQRAHRLSLPFLSLPFPSRLDSPPSIIPTCTMPPPPPPSTPHSPHTPYTTAPLGDRPASSPRSTVHTSPHPPKKPPPSPPPPHPPR